MEKPSLKEVKERFEKAKEVECVYLGKTFDVSGFEKRINYLNCSGYWLDTPVSCSNNIKLWDDKKGYAKILSYKEKTYSITESQIKQLRHNTIHENLQLVSADLKNWFPDVFKTDLIAGKWYKSLRYPKQIIFAYEFKDVQHIKGYGFDTRGKWESCDGKLSWGLPSDGNYREATEQEVTEALTKEAVKRGFKEGVYFINNDGHKVKCSGKIEIYNINPTRLSFGKGNGLIFRDGKWAEIIPTKTKEEAEKELNCKIID